MLQNPDFLDAPFCRRVRAAMDHGVREAAEVAETAISEQRQVRRAISIEIEPELLAQVEARIEAMRPNIEAAFGGPVGAREGTGLLRYEPGGFYRRHRDRGDVPGWPAAARRSVAVVVFLNADFSGGALRLYQDDDNHRDIEAAEGQLVAFRADDLHEALPVVSGVRDVAVDWFYDPEPD